MKKKIFIVFILIALFMTLNYCTSVSGEKELSQNGWKVLINFDDNTFSISHERLGSIVSDVKLVDNKRDKIDFKNYTQKDSEIIIKLANKKSFSLNLLKEKVIFSSLKNFNLKGKAFAGEKRILARTKEQNNNILFASLGPVSANNVNKLFDIKTDTLIIFPKNINMKRNKIEKKFLDISFALGDSTSISLKGDYYKTLGLKFYKPKREYFKNAPVGWSSWYSYYMKADEKALVRESDAVSKYFKDFGMEYIQLDACYTRGEDANYLDWYKKAFPHGGKWIFNYIKSKGLKPALWINLYGSNYKKAEVMDRYPDNFYLRDKNGKLSGACCTADDTVKRLDYSNPDVIKKHLIPMLKIFKEEWGLTYLKDAGWGTWMDYYEKNKENAFNPEKSSREIYVEVQKAARKTLGDDVYMLGCAMHEVGLGFGIYDGSRIGGDDKAVWYPEKKNGMSMQIFFNSLFGGEFLNNIVWHSDPDAVMVRSPLTYEEGKTIVSSIGLLGQLYMASDFMGELPSERIELYRKTIPSTHILPMDLYPFNAKNNIKDGALQCCPKLEKFPKALDLKVSFITGDYDVLALYNWEDEKSEKEISFKELGLDKGEYIIFDFWNEKLLGVFNEKYSTEIPAHGVSVLVIRRKLDEPMFLATSRHITGTVSMKNFKAFDKNNFTISGRSAVEKNYNYKLFIYVPENFDIENVSSEAPDLNYKREGNLLIIEFKGDKKKKKNFAWKVKFKKV